MDAAASSSGAGTGRELREVFIMIISSKIMQTMQYNVYSATFDGYELGHSFTGRKMSQGLEDWLGQRQTNNLLKSSTNTNISQLY